MIALVLDGHLQSSLAIVRSLGARNIHVVCGAERSSAMTLHSRYVADSFVYTSPLNDRERFVEDVVVYMQKYSEECLLYVSSDATALSMLRVRHRLPPNIRLVFPEQSIVESVFDKKQLLERAGQLGIPVPSSCDVDFSKKQDIKFPLVVKPRRSCTWMKDGSGVLRTASIVRSSDVLRSRVEGIHVETGEAPLIQECIEGEEYGIFALCVQGKIENIFAHKRLRSISPHGGASCLRESVTLSEPMVTYAKTLLEDIGWHGVAMVEFKEDSITGIPYLMEINGRFWGSLPLAVFAGVDFPYLYFQHASGRLKETSVEYRIGVRARHFLADVKHLFSTLIVPSSTLPSLHPGKWKTCVSFFRSKARYDVISRKDLKPFFFEIIDSIVRIIYRYD